MISQKVAYSLAENGARPENLSEDHKPNNQEETDRIEAAGGFVDEEANRIDGSLAVSRAMGDFSFKGRFDLPATEQKVTAFPDVKVIKRSPDNQFIILACDGCWDCKTSEEAVDFMHEKVYENQFGKVKKSLD